MSDRGKFSGFSWHMEYHAVGEKKEKAADCAFLTQERICQNKKSAQYLTKCFIASICPHRMTQNKFEIQEIAKKVGQKAVDAYAGIRCSIPIGCPIFSEKFGKGNLVSFETSKRVFSVKFGEKTIRFLYPEAILDEHLTVSESAYRNMLKDIAKVKKG